MANPPTTTNSKPTNTNTNSNQQTHQEPDELVFYDGMSDEELDALLNASLKDDAAAAAPVDDLTLNLEDLDTDITDTNHTDANVAPADLSPQTVVQKIAPPLSSKHIQPNTTTTSNENTANKTTPAKQAANIGSSTKHSDIEDQFVLEDDALAALNKQPKPSTRLSSTANNTANNTATLTKKPVAHTAPITNAPSQNSSPASVPASVPAPTSAKTQQKGLNESLELQQISEHISADVVQLKTQLHLLSLQYHEIGNTTARLMTQLRHLQRDCVDDFSITYEQMLELRSQLVSHKKQAGEIPSLLDLVEEALESELYVAQMRKKR